MRASARLAIPSRRVLALMLLCVASGLAAREAKAQGRSHGGGQPLDVQLGGQPGGDQQGGGFPQWGRGAGGGPKSPPLPGTGGETQDSTTRGGLRLGPPGRWWDDRDFAKSLGLAREQQQRMDEVFKANKGELFRLYRSLEQEESALRKICKGKTPDEAQIDGQIDRVEKARSDLEKANAHMVLAIRKEMTPEQAGKLDAALVGASGN